MKTYTDKYGRVYAIVQADGCRGCDFYKDVQACGEAPDCEGINYKEISQNSENEIKEESVSTEKKAHKHAEVIRAWADGKVVEYYNSYNQKWVELVSTPCWRENEKYRIKPVSEKKAHKHAEIIKAWANGEVVQTRDRGCVWSEIDVPTWGENHEYRIKPNEPEGPVVRWLWSYILGGKWYVSDFFRTEEEVLQEHDNDSVIKLEWTRTEFPK